MRRLSLFGLGINVSNERTIEDHMNTTNTGAGKIELLVAASKWETLAKEAEDLAAYERDIGIDMSQPGQSAGDYRAETYRDCAKSLRLEADTGLAHCNCHFSSNCPSKRSKS